MPWIASLEGVDTRLVFDCFRKAFSDYAYPVFESYDGFLANNARRGFDPALSVAAFETASGGGEEMLGFVLNGSGSWRGRPTAYDLGTGVVPERRGSGIGGRLAAAAAEALRGSSNEVWLLEVLRDNLPAIKTYERSGFRITRELEVLEGRFSDPGRKAPVGYRLAVETGFPFGEAPSLRDFEPSWQNSDEAIRRYPGPLRVLTVRDHEGSLAGFCAMAVGSSIWQLAVGTAHRRKGLGTLLLGAAAAERGGDLRYVNVDARDRGSLALLGSVGVFPGTGQYEMELELR